jgi:hypothetical protein
LDRNESANASLLSDIRSDKHMGWIPAHMWFTFLRLDVPAADLDYDLAISTRPDTVPSLTDAGVTASEARPITEQAGRALWPLAAAGAVGLATFGIGGLLGRRRRTSVGAPA